MSSINFNIADHRNLKEWIACAMRSLDHKITGWEMRHEDVRPRLVFFWADPKNEKYQAFPVELTADVVNLIASDWLESLTRDEFGKQPDHDGDNKRGFRVYNDRCFSFELLIVEPAWIEFPK